jgi:putative transposase
MSGPMGRVASAGDNGAMESLLALLQENMFDGRRWQNRDELRSGIV